MTHVELITTITRAVRAGGAAAALDELRTTAPVIAHGDYHDTLAVFYVWAVDRLVAAGLTDFAIILHPLTHWGTPLAWWDEATLASDAARTHFVPSTLALVSEPQPAEPHDLVAA